MSLRAITLVYKSKIGSASRKALLIALANHANAAGECFPSIKTLARETELSPSTIKRDLKKLEADGLIRRSTRYRQNGSRQSDMITLDLAAIAALDRNAENTDKTEVTVTPPGVTMTPPPGHHDTTPVAPWGGLEPSKESPGEPSKVPMPSASGIASDAADRSFYGRPIVSDSVREYVELYGHKSNNAGPTIASRDLIKRAAANGDAVTNISFLIDEQMLKLVDRDGRDDGDGEYLAITKLGDRTEHWPDDDHELPIDAESDVLASVVVEIIIDVINDHAGDDRHGRYIKIADLIAIARNHPLSEGQCDFTSYVKPAIDAGLLVRAGDFLRPTAALWSHNAAA